MINKCFKLLLVLCFFLASNRLSFSVDWRLVEGFDNTPSWSNSNVQSINCWDSSNCYAIVQHSTKEDYGCKIYTSSNNGISWNLLLHNENGNPQMLNVKFGVSPNPDYYFILSDDNTFLEKSTDGGNTFKIITLDQNNYFPKNIVMYDTLIGIASNSEAIFTTLNGWETFEKYFKKNVNETYDTPLFLDSNTLIMRYLSSPWPDSLGMALVEYSINNNSWDTITYFDKQIGVGADYIYSLFFVNDNLGFASGRRSDKSLSGDDYYDIINRTTDGGNNWELVLKKLQHPERGFYDIAFADENNGVAVGYWGKIAMTNDGGETWVYEPTPNEMDNCRKMLVTWAGKTPLIGTWDAGIFRYEGDFFKFPDDTMSVVEDYAKEGIEIYPNPAKEYIELRHPSLTLPAGEEGIRIEIFDVLGNRHTPKNPTPSPSPKERGVVRINISNLQPGIYFVRVGARVIKFVKM